MLEQSDDGRYQAGTYYDYVKSVVEESLNHFLSDTTFPYDADTNTAVITSLGDFAEMVKPASKGLGAFDELDAGQGENTLFGYNDGEGAHFDEVLGSILSDIGSEYAADYTEDLQKTDGEENSVSTRLAMYSPLYYLLDSDDDTEEALLS